VSAAASQTLPLLGAQAAGAALNATRHATLVIQSVQETEEGSSASYGGPMDSQMWLKPFGSWANQDDRNGYIGYGADSYGVVLGGDGRLDDMTRLGAFFYYSQTDADGNSSMAPTSAIIDSYQAGIYGNRDLSNASEINFQADLGLHQTSGARSVGMLLPGQTARSEYDSWSGHLGLGLTRIFTLSEDISVTPGVRVDYIHFNSDGYQETGAGILNLTVDSQTTRQLLLEASGKLEQKLDENAVFTANLGFRYDAINEPNSVTSAFAGAPGATFVTDGVDQEPWSVIGGLGLVSTLDDKTELSLDYNIEVKEDFTNQSGSLKLRRFF
jgi:outer membrane autotransporter protein